MISMIIVNAELASQFIGTKFLFDGQEVELVMVEPTLARIRYIKTGDLQVVLWAWIWNELEKAIQAEKDQQ